MSILVSQRVISEEMAKIQAGAQGGETQPRLDFAPYRSAVLRHPARDLRYADPEGAEMFAPVFGVADVGALDCDLTAGGAGEPIGERIMVRGRVLDGTGRPVRRQLVEIWQANAAGRYVHQRDQHPAPLDRRARRRRPPRRGALRQPARLRSTRIPATLSGLGSCMARLADAASRKPLIQLGPKPGHELPQPGE